MDDLPVPSLVVLIGPSGAGKSTWAAAHFEPDEVVASDRLRGVVGRGEDDLDASDDAFALLDTIVVGRLSRRLTTVVDTLGLDEVRRQRWRELAAAHDLPCVAVGFATDAGTCRERNRARPRPVPAEVLRRQLATWAALAPRLADEGFTAVVTATDEHGADRPVRVAPERLRAAGPAAAAQQARPVGLRFGLHLSAFPWAPADMAAGLTTTARAAEAAGFESLWVMDHVRQIPQVGRDWDPMLDPATALAWLAAATEQVRLGTLVTPVTVRPLGLLAKAVATLDVLSGGRAVCGLGLGWYARELEAYGMALPPVAERVRTLADALELLPLLWGPGAPAFAGRTLEVPEAIGYPRPLQAHVPILVGGGGERSTLRLAARHADAVNLLGDADVVRHKVAVLERHGAEAGRDPAAVEVTHLGTALTGADRAGLSALVDRLRPRRAEPEAFAASVGAATVADQIGRARLLADAGVDVAIVRLPDLGLDGPGDVAAIERFGAVIEAFA